MLRVNGLETVLQKHNIAIWRRLNDFFNLESKVNMGRDLVTKASLSLLIPRTNAIDPPEIQDWQRHKHCSEGTSYSNPIFWRFHVSCFTIAGGFWFEEQRYFSSYKKQRLFNLG